MNTKSDYYMNTIYDEYAKCTENVQNKYLLRPPSINQLTNQIFMETISNFNIFVMQIKCDNQHQCFGCDAYVHLFNGPNGCIPT